jgi:hypothetical protein
MRRLSSDLREFIHLLNTKSVRYVIVGAWALAFHGRPRYTGDIDIFVAREQENADRPMEVIEAFGFGHSGIKRDDFLQVDHVIQLGREPSRIDTHRHQRSHFRRGVGEPGTGKYFRERRFCYQPRSFDQK